MKYILDVFSSNVLLCQKSPLSRRRIGVLLGLRFCCAGASLRWLSFVLFRWMSAGFTRTASQIRALAAGGATVSVSAPAWRHMPSAAAMRAFPSTGAPLLFVVSESNASFKSSLDQRMNHHCKHRNILEVKLLVFPPEDWTFNLKTYICFVQTQSAIEHRNVCTNKQNLLLEVGFNKLIMKWMYFFILFHPQLEKLLLLYLWYFLIKSLIFLPTAHDCEFYNKGTKNSPLTSTCTHLTTFYWFSVWKVVSFMQMSSF